MASHPTLNLISPARLVDVLPGFDAYLASEGAGWQSDRRRKAAFFAEHGTLDGLYEIDEGSVRELVHLLWAFSGWTHKEWLCGEILKSGLATIQDALWQLFYGDDLLENRFDFFKTHIRMMGAAAISELLAEHDPTIYPMWNKRSRRGLIALGVDESLLPRSSQISGAQYVGYAHLMRRLLNDVQVHAPPIDDLLTLDFLLFFVSQQAMRAPEVASSLYTWAADPADFHHDDVIDQLLQLGDGLGFEVDKEVAIVAGSRIDAVWRSRIANLGTITYAFEVHRHGNRDSAIMNLHRASTDPTVQKVVVVANEKELAIFRREIASMPEAFRKAAGYFDAAELQHALEHLDALKTTLHALGLMNTASLFD